MSFIGTQQKCKACEKTVYPVELLSADGVSYHKSCFKCSHCKGTLKLSNYSSMEGVLYCKPHYEQLFKETGNFSKNFQSPAKSAEKLTPEMTRSPSKAAGMFSGTQDKCATCGKTAYPLEKVTVESQSYQKSCFKCSHGGCSLTPSNYAALDGILYCKPHFSQLFKEKGSCNHSSILLQNLIRLSQPLKESLSKTQYTPPETYANVSVKSKLLSLLPDPPTISDSDYQTKVKDFALCCAALMSASNSTSPHLSWLPNSLSISAASAFKEFSNAYYNDNAHAKCSMKVGELELDFSSVIENEKKLLIELMPEVLPLLKDTIKESAVDASDESDGVSAASARAPVAYAVLAAYQLGWIVRQVDAPYIGKLCPFMIPCSLIALDHWSPEVKGQGMASFIHLARNANAGEIGGYADAILEACFQNIASDDDIWHYVVEMSVLLVALILKSNPHSSWYEKLLGEMLNHLERQPRNKQRRVVWLTHCEPLLDGLGLVLLAHFRRLFPLFFKWMHADDDETVLLVLERMITVVRLTWIRNSPHIERLVDELITLYKDAALKVAREDIRLLILQILKLIYTLNKPQLDATWLKYKDDPNITALIPSLS